MKRVRRAADRAVRDAAACKSAMMRAGDFSRMSPIAELERRNVIRVAGLYLVGAWLATQVASTLLPLFEAPAWIARAVVIALAIGFIPALVLSWFYALTPQGLRRDSDAPRSEFDRAASRRIDRAIIVVLLLALVCFATDKFVLAPRRAAYAAVKANAAMASAERTSTPKSIAVLPLANESGEDAEQYFSDGLSEDLITALAQFDGLKVIGRNSSFQFRGTQDDILTIGRKLGVTHLLAGSVRRDGAQVRISAELVDAADGSTAWSQRYDRPYRDLFALQDEIAHAVASALRARLLGAPVQSERPPSGNLDAYNAFLQGWFYYSRRTEPNLRKAVASFDDAVRLDPQYAYALATGSRAWMILGSTFLAGADAQPAYAKARASADRALALAPNLAVAHIARGLVLQIADFDWHGADAEVRRALELAPDDPVARFAVGFIAATLGDLPRAADDIGAALARDPLHASWHGTYAGVLAAAGRLDDAERAIRRAIELQPGAAGYHRVLASIAIARGDAAAARAAAGDEPEGTGRDLALAQALQIGADRAAADRALQDAIATHAGTSAYAIAQIHALRHDADAAFDWLERARAAREPGLAGLLYDPLLASLRADARFAAFCRGLGLPAPAPPPAASTP
jgi:TolB-like protein/Tfp pilus assembly protein PilF